MSGLGSTLELNPGCIRTIDERGLQWLDADGSKGFVSFAECQANVALTLPRVSTAGVPLVGFRDGSASKPWIEFATRPPLRFVFEPSPPQPITAGSRFVARKHPSGYLELLQAVGDRGFAFGDLS